jgi:hypothetical protein
MSLFDRFVNAPREYTLIPFWLLNDELSEEELKRQIDDFEAHGVYGFIPHARMGLPETIGFMSEAWLHFTKVCVEYAAQKGMYVILYDEGMYPSGSCAGQVVAVNPRHAARCVERRKKGEALGENEELIVEDATWAYVHCRSMGTIRGVHYGEDDGQPGAPPAGDLLNPEAMASFRRLVLDRHYEALKEHFGKTVIGVFTDEPSILGRNPKKDVRPWTWGLEAYLQTYLGYDFVPHLAALWDGQYPDAERYRRDFSRAVDRRFEEVYYAPYGKWCEDHGVALTGHPAGPDDIGVMKYFQIPGQDIVWRYIEPFKDKSLEGDQSTMAKCSVSALRHYGGKRNANECFGAYGWEFTYDEMRYITNWLFVRGVNLIIPHAFYYSLRDKRRDERPPDVGPNSSWWKEYKSYADFVRRLSWLLSNGRHVCSFAILGRPNALPWRAARVMFETQHDFNYLDTDTLRTQCVISDKAVTIRDMTYPVVILDGPQFTDSEAVKLLRPMIDAGRVIAYGDEIAGVSTAALDAPSLVRMLDVLVFPDTTVTPANPDLRYIHMKYEEADVYLFANEGRSTIDVNVFTSVAPPREWWDPCTAQVVKNTPLNRLVLPPLTTRLLVT